MGKIRSIRLILAIIYGVEISNVLYGQMAVYDPNISPDIYRNPIIYADYSDPDVVRVGDDFYMVSSSFSHFPGLPILHSRDLVNWEIIGHACQEYPDVSFAVPHHGDAIWAPSIRYHNGEFFIYFGDPDRGVYMTKAKNAAGPWTPLKLIKKVVGWIDCCPLWDDDGKAYLVHAYANSRSGVKSILLINEMSPDGEEILGTSTLVFNGQKDHPTCEGPKLYKRNGYYYIFTPAGGVATGWQTVLRSKNIYGPYEDKIVLEQGSTVINGPHQGAWVDTPSGTDWFVHFQDKGTYGRVVLLEPMTWQEDWPVIGKDIDENGIGEPLIIHEKPIKGKSTLVPQTSDNFEGDQPGLQWQWQANPSSDWYELKQGQLVLKGLGHTPLQNLWMMPNLLMQKFPAPEFSATTEISLKEGEIGDEAGLIIFGLDYSRISLKKISSRKYQLVLQTCHQADKGKIETKVSEISGQQNFVHFRVAVKEAGRTTSELPKASCQFQYSFDGKQFNNLGEPFLAKEGKWVGAKVGLYALGSKKLNASFKSFDIGNNAPEK